MGKVRGGLRRAPSRFRGWTCVVMPDSAEVFGTPGLVLRLRSYEGAAAAPTDARALATRTAADSVATSYAP